MKFFTIDMWIADQDLTKYDRKAAIQLQKAKNDYLASISNKLPPELLILNQVVNLHDGRLRELNLDVSAKSLIMILDAEENETNEDCKVALYYDGVRNFITSSDPNKGLSGPNGYGDIGHDEIELLEDQVYEHRFLFSSGIEIAIQFSHFRFTVL